MVNKIFNEQSNQANLKYLTRLYYYGKLLDYEFVSGAMVLKFVCYTASEFFGGSTPIRFYVPTGMEEKLQRALDINANYFIIAAPYRISMGAKYQHRVDLLLNIFEEVI